MKKILVPTDFSECADKALQYAIILAKKAEAEIILLHVCDLLDPTFSGIKKIMREYNEAKTAELTLSLQRLKESVESNEVRITTMLYNGDIVDSILTASNEQHADLIVMGTLGATGLKKLFFGTKAAAVINKSVIPVIAIPADYKASALKEIVIAIDNAKHSTRIFEPVFTLSRLFEAKITTVVFTEEAADAAKRMEQSDMLGRIEKKLDTHFIGNDVESVQIHGQDFHESMQEYVEDQKTDLLVMLTHERTFMQNLFKLSMTREMAYHITVPLMALKGLAP